MTANEIRSQFNPWTPVMFYDMNYAKPRLNWLTDTYYPWFRDWLTGLGRRVWERTFDCDDFAMGYVFGCKVAHANTLTEKLAHSSIFSDSLAVGIFCYMSARGPHAIVVAFTEEGRVFIEPQTGKVLPLTTQEISTCFSASF